jgi:hypothetical protein
VIELGVRVPERIGNRLVEEELFDSEKDRSPEEKVVAEPVVDQLVGVLVWDHQAELVELLKESQVRQVRLIRRVKLPVKAVKKRGRVEKERCKRERERSPES